MFFYKETIEDGSVRYCETSMERKEDNFEEISQEEYVSAWNKMYAEAEEQSRRESEAMAEAEKTYIEQLEAENAALLFQVLTGEEYSDV